MFFRCTVILSRLLVGTLRHQQKCVVMSFHYVAKLYPQALANFVFPSSKAGPSFGKLYHRFVYHRLLRPHKFKIRVHNSLQNNGMVLYVVKIMAAGVRRAINSDGIASIRSLQFGKFQRILKSFEISVNISSFREGICWACSGVHMAQVFYIFVHSYCSYY